jgi:citrate lyase subunit beta / citryl-CoA lyase
MHPAPARRLARSYLLAPGSHERLLQEVFGAGADAVVLDLEEAVAAEHKTLARQLVAATLRQHAEETRPDTFVRINPVESGAWREDLDAVVGPGLDGVRVARTETAHEIDQVHALLTLLERERDLPLGRLAVIPTVETAAGLLAAERIAAAPRVRALAFGPVDFLRDVCAGPDAGDYETLHARAHLVVVSRAAGILPPIAPVYARLTDEDDLRRSSEAARRLGFFGRFCVHPSQMPLLHAVFTPSSSEVSGSRALLALLAEETGNGDRPTLRDGRPVDPGVVDRARAFAELAARLGLG